VRPNVVSRLIFAFATLLVTPARAGDVERSAAQVLFDEARTLMDAGSFSEACPKLAQSQRLDPASGTLLNLALCREREGKTASAWLAYTETVSLAEKENNAERKQLALERIAEIEPDLSRLRLIVPEPTPKDFWVAVDDVRLNQAVWSVAVPVDPGTHRISAGAPGMKLASRSVDVPTTGSTIELRLPELEPLPAAIPAAKKPPVRTDEPSSNDGHWLATGASFGLAAAGLAVGTYAGIRAGAEWDERNAHCTGGCNQRGVDAGERANEFATVSNIAFSVGIVALGVGSYLLVTTPERPKTTALRVSAAVGGRAAFVAAQGAF
jgi:hypothetical protein